MPMVNIVMWPSSSESQFPRSQLTSLMPGLRESFPRATKTRAMFQSFSSRGCSLLKVLNPRSLLPFGLLGMALPRQELGEGGPGRLLEKEQTQSTKAGEGWGYTAAPPCFQHCPAPLTLCPPALWESMASHSSSL